MAVGPFDNPFENTHIFTKARPEEFAVFVFAEPVDIENAGWVGDVAAELQPMVEVIGHVVAAEWEHGKRVTAHFTDFTRGRGRHFTAHRRGRINAKGPVK